MYYMDYKTLITERNDFKRKHVLSNISRINKSYEDEDYDNFIKYSIICFYPKHKSKIRDISYIRKKYFDKFHYHNYGNLRQIVLDIGIILKVKYGLKKVENMYTENDIYKNNYNKKFKLMVLPKFN